jgi:hemoglobin-like flavoprotein
LYALETHLDDFWTEDVEKAWTEIYIALSKVMIEAGKKYGK